MGMSTFYHTYNSISRYWNETLLRLDLVFVAVMIISQTGCLTFTAYHSSPTLRNCFCMTLLVLLFLFVGMGLNPEFSHSKYECYRIIIYGGLLITCNGMAVIWLFFVSTETEI
mmetsp:Transcript_42017/g.30234  ORF Transcript_42017/g.30234 Transcript_42017/m.30234 type:complete len:113 (-) Transcript_42017:173-511(-)